MRTKILIISSCICFFISSTVFAQEPVKKDKTTKTEKKEDKEVKQSAKPHVAPATQSQQGQTISSDKKAESKGKGKGLDKNLEIGEPVPGADITLEQEPEDLKIKQKEPVIDDMMLEDDR